MSRGPGNSNATLERVAGTVRYMDNGYLHCEACDNIWCRHIEAVVLSSQDSQSLVKRAIEYPHFSVPILPTESLFASIWLDILPRKRFLAKAYLQSPINAIPERVCRGDDHFIAFLSPGEGRAGLRVAIWDAFAKELGGDVSCASLGHTWDVSIEATKLQKSGARGMMLNAWHQKWYNKCHVCFMREGAVVEFDSDLIPDAKPASPGWSGVDRRRRKW